MKPRNPAPGKIMVHGHGTGDVNETDVQRRASELASISGRSPAPGDIARARRELSGETSPPPITENVPPSTTSITRDPSEPPSDSGHKVPDREPVDEESLNERLVEDGVEEAQHDQMVAARRNQRREER